MKRMKGTGKKLIAYLMTLAMLVTLIPASVFADDDPVIGNESCIVTFNTNNDDALLYDPDEQNYVHVLEKDYTIGDTFNNDDVYLTYNETEWTFLGWAESADGDPLAEPIEAGEGMELYAVWQHNGSYIVTFHAEGGYFWDGAEEQATFTEQYSGVSELSFPDDPLNHDGSVVFAGWIDNRGNFVDKDEAHEVQENMDLYARWAYQMSANSNVSGSYDSSKECFYKVVPQESGTYVAAFEDFGGVDPQLVIYDSHYGTLAFTNSFDESCEADLEAGETYYIGVSDLFDDEPSFVFAFSFMVKDGVNEADCTFIFHVNQTRNPQAYYWGQWDETLGDYEHMESVQVAGVTGQLVSEYGWEPHNDDPELDFLGWAQSADAEEPDNTILVSDGLEVFAVWGSRFCTVTYDVNNERGARIWDNDLCSYTTAVPYIMERGSWFDENWPYINYRSDVMTFDGWFTQKTGGEQVTNEEQVTSDLTVYAHWTYEPIPELTLDVTAHCVYDPEGPNQVYYQFSPDTDGLYVISSSNWSDPGSTASVHLYDSDFNELAEDSYSGEDGFRLLWMLEAGHVYYYGLYFGYDETMSCDVLLEEQDSIEVIFEAGEGAYFDKDGQQVGSVTVLLEEDSDFHIYNNPAGCPVSEDPRRVFRCWTDDENGGMPAGSNIVLTDGMHLYPCWRTACQITLNAGDHGYFEIDETDPDNPEYVTVRSIYRTPGEYDCYDLARPTPIHADYEFDGWSADPEAEKPDDMFMVEDEDLELYAVWTPLCRVTLHANAPHACFDITTEYNEDTGEWEDVPVTEVTVLIRAGSVVTANTFDVPQNDDPDARFAGWSVSDTATSADPQNTVYGDMDLYAVWGEECRVTYQANQSVNPDAWYEIWNEDEGGYEYASSITGTAAKGSYLNPKSNAPENENDDLRFLGYSRNAEATVPDAQILIEGETTLYAVWGSRWFTVTYDAGGPYLMDEDWANLVSVRTHMAEYDEGFDENCFYMEYNADLMTFNGWYTEREGGERVEQGAELTGSITVYAHWTLKQIPELEPGVPVHCMYEEGDARRSYYQFTPTEDGLYHIYSYNQPDWEENPYVTLYDEDFNELQEDRYGGDNGFSLTRFLEAGNLYYYAVDLPFEDGSSCDFLLEEVESISVTFEAGDGAYIVKDGEQLGSVSMLFETDSELYIYNSPAGRPVSEDPGRAFLCWTDDVNGGIPDDSYIELTDGMHLYPCWRTAYQITLYAGDHGYFEIDETDPEDPEYVTVCSIYRTPGEYECYDLGQPTPINADYEFLGWSADPDADEPDYWIMVEDADLVLYAVWAPLCRVTLHANAPHAYFDTRSEYNEETGEWEEFPVTEITVTTRAGNVVTASSFDVPQNDDPDVKFAGWAENDDATQAGLQITVNEDTDLYAVWGEPCEVIFDANVAANPEAFFEIWDNEEDEFLNVESITKTYAKGSYLDPKANEPHTENEDLRFLGYSVEADSVVPDESILVEGSGMRLYAVWGSSRYTITYDAGGPYFWDDERENLVSTRSCSVWYYDRFDPYYFNLVYQDLLMTFDGWYTEREGGEKIENNAVLTGSMTVYAHWTKKQIPELVPDEPIHCEYAEGGARDFYYQFTPAEDGLYRIYSYNQPDWEQNPSVTLYDEDFKELMYDKYGGDNGFSLTCFLEAGKTYYFLLSLNFEDGSSCDVLFEEIEGITVVFEAGDDAFFEKDGEPVSSVTTMFEPGSELYIYNSPAGRPISEDPRLVFKCWTDDVNGEMPEETHIELTEGMHLYPCWKAAYKITLHTGEQGYFSVDETDPDDPEYERERSFYKPDGYYYYSNIEYEAGTPTALDSSRYQFCGWSTQEDAVAVENEFEVDGEDIDLYAVWAELYTVTLHANHGEDAYFDTEEYYDDEEERWVTVYLRTQTSYLIEGSGITNDSYGAPYNNDTSVSFAGWSENADAKTAEEMIRVYGDMDIYAVWGTPCTVTYHANREKNPDAAFDYADDDEPVVTVSRTVAKGSYVDPYAMEPEYGSNWSDDGLVFLGYSTDPDATEPDESILVTEDTDLYAVWGSAFVTVTYHAGGPYFWDDAYENRVDTKSAREYRGSRFLETCFTLSYHPLLMTFLGWYTEAEGGDQVTEEHVLNGDLDVYAHWRAAAIPALTPDVLTTVTYDPAADPEENREVLYSFAPEEDGMYRIRGVESSEPEMPAHVRLYDEYMNQIGSAYDSTDEYDFQLIRSLDAGKTYYYGVSFDLDGSISCKIILEQMPAVSVTFVTEDGTWFEKDGNRVQSVTKLYLPESWIDLGDDMLNTPWTDNPRRGFKGWSRTEGAEYPEYEEIRVSEGLILYACWQNNYEIRLHSGATGYFDYEDYWDEDDESYYEYERDIVRYIPAGCDIISYIRTVPRTDSDTLAFAGWAETADTDRPVYALTAEADTDLYAVWNEKYTVNFHANHTGAYWSEYDEYDDEITFTSFTREYGKYRKLPSHIFLDDELYWNDDWEVIGWSADPDAEEPDDPLIVTEDEMDLYAVWCDPYLHVTYNANGGYLDPEDSELVRQTEDYYADGEIYFEERAAYHENPMAQFLGWYSEETGGIRYTHGMCINGNLTVYAHWKIRTPKQLPLGEAVEVTYEQDEEVLYAFTPEESGTYRLYSFGRGKADPVAALYNEHMRELGSDYDSRGEGNFSLDYELKAGDTYYYGVRDTNGYADSSFSIKLQKMETVNVILHANNGTDGYFWTDEYDQMIVTAQITCIKGEHISNYPEPYSDSGTFRFAGWSTDAEAEKADEGIVPDSDLELYAVWKGMVSVTLHANHPDAYYTEDGQQVTQKSWSVFEGARIYSYMQRPECADEEYKFYGWSTDPDAEDADYSILITAKTKDLYGVWKRLHTVTYHVNEDRNPQAYYKVYDEETGEQTGTSLTWTRQIGHGEFLYLTSDLTSPGYESCPWNDDPKLGLAGWAADPDATEPLYYTTVMEDTDLFAIWKPNVTVTYHAFAQEGYEDSYWIEVYDEDTDEYVDVQTLQQTCLVDSLIGGQDIDLYTSREDKQFAGWTTDPSSSEAMTRIRASEGLDLYAVWDTVYPVAFHANIEKNDKAYFLEWVDGFEDQQRVPDITRKYALDSDINSWAQTAYSDAPGWVFAGWSVDPYAAEPDEAIIVTGPLEVYAVWRVAYPVTFHAGEGCGYFEDPNSETGISLTSVGYLEKGTVLNEDYISISPISTRDDYLFCYWSQTNEETECEEIEVNSALDVYAVWKEKVTVTFDAVEEEGGYFHDTETNIPLWTSVVTKGSTLSAFSWTTPDNDDPQMIFRYWMGPDGQPYDFDQPVTGDITLTAKWYRVVATPIEEDVLTDAAAAAGEIIYFSFVPEEDGWYSFASLDAADNSDPEGAVMNWRLEYLTSNWNNGDDKNFLMLANLSAGRTYYLSVYDSMSADTACKVIVRKVTPATITLDINRPEKDFCLYYDTTVYQQCYTWTGKFAPGARITDGTPFSMDAITDEFVFRGWSEDPDAQEGVKTFVVTGTTTLYAIWGLPTSGECGDGLTYELTELGTGGYKLTITGTGEMYDYDNAEYGNAPWTRYMEQIREVQIGEGATSVGARAFAGADALTDISLPTTMEAIGSMAFTGCEALSALEIPAGVQSFGYGVFEDCLSLESLTIPEGTTHLATGMFRDCSGLQELFLPSTLESCAGGNIIEGCTQLTIYYNGTETEWDAVRGTSEIDKSIVEFLVADNGGACGENAFWELTEENVLKITGTGDMYDYAYDLNSYTYTVPWNDLRDSIAAIEIADGITSIGDYAFISCKNAVTVTIPSTVTDIGEYAFSGCSSVETLDVPSGLTKINEMSFANMTSLKSFTIPNGVTSIGLSAFECDNALQTITIPASVASFEGTAFWKCSNLKTVVVSEGIKDLGSGTFSYCSSLEKVTLPSTLTRISSTLFAGCGKLANVVLPASVTEIGYAAFRSCNSLKNLTILKNVKTIDDAAFAGVTSLTITGYKGTAAETAANKNDAIRFIAILDSKDYTVTIADQTFNGSAMTPVPVVKYGKTSLKNKTDFTVTYKNNKKVGTATATITGKGNYTGRLTATFRICFTDVPSDHKRAKAVYWAAENSIVSGYTDGSYAFGVNDKITRGQFVMILWRMAGKPNPNGTSQTFSDVPVTSNFYKAVQWAYERKITTGYTKGAKKGSFGVKDEVTRGQLVMFLWRYLEKPAPKGNTQTFSDVPTNHSFYKAIQWAYENKVTAGKNGAFLVNNTCTRGECVAFLYNYYGKH